jgi:hypothetical protein
MEFLVNAQVKASSKECKIYIYCPSVTCTGNCPHASTCGNNV